MTSGDFEAQVNQSVADQLALIQTAAQAAKARIVKSVEVLHDQPNDFSVAQPAVAAPRAPRAAVDFSAAEPAFFKEPAFPDDPAFGEGSGLPHGAISFDDLAVESVDDEGIPVWEDSP
jgi:enamine deaminase RidA (YjgF/YER057c/UK114 family)